MFRSVWLVVIVVIAALTFLGVLVVQGRRGGGVIATVRPGGQRGTR